ncbi:LOW QUALITY PROTEIN: F-box only protein 7-like [Argopecten irradians]|uniref:LOW QUALITY PROTEIN: F-box only protein 7-like n=1 Tax=Argopecten irradians TaxID=31199 RepID=UPI003723AC90
MKLRLKLGRETKIQEFDDTCVVSNIYHVVQELFPHLNGEFILSLNKKDSLDINKTLASQGIVSGDLVYVVTTDNDDAIAPVSKPQLLSKDWTDSVQQTSGVGGHGNFTQTIRTGATSKSSEGQTTSRKNVSGPNQQSTSGASLLTETPDDDEQVSEMDTHEHVDLSVVNRYLNEPVLCRESHGEVVPAVLSDMYRSAGVTCSAEAMCTVLHVLLLETGYTTVRKKVPDGLISDDRVSRTNPVVGSTCTSSDVLRQTDNADSTSSDVPGPDNPEREMPEGWRDKPGQYCLCYNHVQTNCTETTPCYVVTCVPMGSVLVVHGKLQENEDKWFCHVNLNTKDFIRTKTTPHKGAAECYQNLEKLSQVFKDLIAHPMLQHYRSEHGLPPLYGIFAVSHEVKLKILGMLDVVSLLNMSETCKEFNHLCKDRYAWRRVYLKDFENRNNNTLAQDWTRLYRQEYRLRKERRRIWKRNPMPMFGSPVLPSFGLPPPGPFHPGILNGDHDLDPVFGHYDRRMMPNSLIEQRTQPSSALFRPRFDPVGPLPGHFLTQGRNSGQRDRRGQFGGRFGGGQMF